MHTSSDSCGEPIYRSPRAPKVFPFAPKDHKELCERLGMLDMEAGAKVAKSGFYFLKGDLALLEIALSLVTASEPAKIGPPAMCLPER